MRRDWTDLLGGGAMVALGLAVAAYSAAHYDTGTLRRMGPGFLPLGLGVMLAIFGAIIALPAWSRPGQAVALAWREALCARHGWQALFPLFGADTTTLARTMLAGGLRATLCCVDTAQLDAGFAGRDYDAALLDALPSGIDHCGENGEFHTVVHAGPMFTTAIALRRGDGTLDQDRFQRTGFLL